MKKYLLLLASAALLLVGCAKEKFEGGQVEGMTTVSFTASLESGVATKAAVDGDGAADSVNRCIMEIYYGDELFARQYAPVTNKVAAFTAQVVSNRTYTVAFWADKVDTATTATGLATDKYYATTSLKEITIKGSYVGNDDARDAFYHVGEYTVAQAGSSFGGGENDKILLKRPFAQMNVITTDWDKASSATGLAPEKVDVTIKNALISFNAVTEQASGSETLNYQAAVYTPAASGTNSEVKTLSMDYLFASKDKAVIDIDWKALHGTDANVKHSFAAVPYQRNYRTNIKGALLTTQGQWTVTVDPTWATPEYTHPVVIATTLAEAQAALGPESSSGTEAAGTVIVKPEAVTNRNQEEDKEKDYVETTTPGITLPDGAKAIEFVLTQQSKKDVTFELPALPNENFYWYIRHEENYPTENLNIKVDSHDATRVIVDAPNNTHVVLNDVEYSHVIAITGDNTLVIPQGIKVKKLTVKKGGVEIHGIVEELEVAPGESQKVYFRECEGLSAGVFAAIKGEGHDYIDSPMYAYELVGEKYNIYKLPVVAMIGEKEYPSIAAAVAAAKANDVIEVVAESVEMPALKKDGITVKGNGTTKVTKFGGLSGKNVTLDGFEFTVETNPSGENFVIKNSKFTGTNGLRWAYAYGEVLIENCILDTKTYGIHFDGNTGGIVTVKNCEITGFNTFNPLLIFDNCKFVDSKIDNKYYVVQSWSNIVIKNCSFSEKWCDTAGAQTIGLTTETGLAEISNCTFATGTVYDACKNSELGVIAIDATGNATDGFTAGTFMAKQASDIKVAGLNEVVPVEGKENVYTIAPKQFAETTVAFCNGVEYETLNEAFDAARAAMGGTITLVADVVLAKTINWNGADPSKEAKGDGDITDCSNKYTFDLNGYHVTPKEGTSCNIQVKGCEFNIKDSKGGGYISNPNGFGFCFNANREPYLDNCGVLNIYGGEYIGKNSDPCGQFSHTYGLGSSGETNDGYVCAKIINIYDGEFQGLSCDNAMVNIRGGHFTSYIYKGSRDDTNVYKYNKENDAIFIYGGKFDVKGIKLAKEGTFDVMDITKDYCHIYAGDFNFDPSACVEEGSSVKKVDDRWIVTQNN